MDGDSPEAARQGPPDFESEMVDLTDASLAELRSLGDSALIRALRRIVHEAEHPQDVTFSWDSSI